MSVRFSEDVVPLSDLKVNPDKVIDRVQESHRPILLTSHGRVVQRLEDYEKTLEELRFVKAVAQESWSPRPRGRWWMRTRFMSGSPVGAPTMRKMHRGLGSEG